MDAGYAEYDQNIASSLVTDDHIRGMKWIHKDLQMQAAPAVPGHLKPSRSSRRSATSPSTGKRVGVPRPRPKSAPLGRRSGRVARQPRRAAAAAAPMPTRRR